MQEIIHQKGDDNQDSQEYIVILEELVDLSRRGNELDFSDEAMTNMQDLALEISWIKFH